MKLNVKRYLLLLWCLSVIYICSAEVKNYDFSVKNNDGVTIYYCYSNNGVSVCCYYRSSSVSYEQAYRSDYKGVIIIPDSVTYMNRTRKVIGISTHAFTNCTIDSLYIPNTIEYISRRAFKNCKIESIRLPEGLKEIDYEAFLSCKMKSINIPSTVKYIYADAFKDCSSLNKVITDDIEAWCHILFYYSWPYKSEYCYGSNPLTYGVLYSNENKQIRDLVIPDGVTSIPEYLFNFQYNNNGGQTTFRSIKFPSSLNYINKFAFAYNKALSNIEIKEGLEVIKEKAFYNCFALSSLKLPTSMKTIGQSAFEGCPLNSVYITENIKSIGSKAFNGNDIPEVVSLIKSPFDIPNDVFTKNTYYNATLYVPTGTSELYRSCSGWNNFIYIVEGSPSEIQNITLDKNINAPIYDLNGKKLKEPSKGIYIVGRKKVVVK